MVDMPLNPTKLLLLTFFINFDLITYVCFIGFFLPLHDVILSHHFFLRSFVIIKSVFQGFSIAPL